MQFFSILSFAFVLLSGAVPMAQAQMSSTNYQIKADSLNSAGALSSSANYQLSDTMAEAVIGVGSSANYIAKDGFWYMVNTYLQLSVDSNSIDLGALTPGTPVTGQTIVSVSTDAWNGYALSASKDHPLRHTNGVTEIPDFNGSVAVPLLWQSPNTTGLGFTISNGTGVESKWGSSPNFAYAAIPDSTTVIHTKTGYSSGFDNTTVQYKLDVDTSQRSGSYSAIVTYTATASL